MPIFAVSIVILRANSVFNLHIIGIHNFLDIWANLVLLIILLALLITNIQISVKSIQIDFKDIKNEKRL